MPVLFIFIGLALTLLHIFFLKETSGTTWKTILDGINNDSYLQLICFIIIIYGTIIYAMISFIIYNNI
jgi:hypothetical protein